MLFDKAEVFTSPTRTQINSQTVPAKRPLLSELRSRQLQGRLRTTGDGPWDGERTGLLGD